MFRFNRFPKSMGLNLSKDKQDQKHKNRLIEVEMKRQKEAENKIVKLLLLGNRT